MNEAAWKDIYPLLESRAYDYQERDYEAVDDPTGHNNPWLWANVPWISKERVSRLTRTERPQVGPKTYTTGEVLAMLKKGGYGGVVSWPALPKGLRDSRATNIRFAARNKGGVVDTHKLLNGDLLVWCRGEQDWNAMFGQPEFDTGLQIISLQERNNLITQDRGEAFYHSRFLPVYDDYEEVHPAVKRPPYRMYIYGLIDSQIYEEGSAVVYPYTANYPIQNQQIRLHQEAQRYRIEIKLRQIDAAHVLVTLVRYLPDYLVNDPRREFEKRLDEDELNDARARKRDREEPGKFHG